MNHERAATAVVDGALQVHRAAGPGMLESAYESMMEIELRERGFRVERQRYLDLVYRGRSVERAYCIDMLIDDCVVVEIKSVERVAAVHLKQVLTYLRLTGLHVGLLLNFGQSTLKGGGIHRVVNGTPPRQTS